MSKSVFRALGVRILKHDGQPLEIADLNPILMPTSGLLEAIVRDGGPKIRPQSVRLGEHSLTLAALDGTLIFLSCMCEETSVIAETRYMVQSRRRELARAFSNIMSRNHPPSSFYGHDSDAVTAIFLLAAAFNSAQELISFGNHRRRLYSYTIDALHLKVIESESELKFEVLPAFEWERGAREFLQ